jgi:hypothetical protein
VSSIKASGTFSLLSGASIGLKIVKGVGGFSHVVSQFVMRTFVR